jgi:hypothetical protein
MKALIFSGIDNEKIKTEQVQYDQYRKRKFTGEWTPEMGNQE